MELPEHHTYVELFLTEKTLLFNKEISSIETINDTDSLIIELFECAKHPDIFLDYIESENRTERVRLDTNRKNKYKRVTFFLQKLKKNVHVLNDFKLPYDLSVPAFVKLCGWDKYPEWLHFVLERFRTIQVEKQRPEEILKRYNNPKICIMIDGNEAEKWKSDLFIQEVLTSKSKILYFGNLRNFSKEIPDYWRKTSNSDCSTEMWINHIECTFQQTSLQL